MQKMKRLVFGMLLAALLAAATLAMAAETVIVQVPVAKIKSYGNIPVPVTLEEMEQAGYAFGDVLRVSFGDETVTLPYGTAYSDVDSGCPVLVYLQDKCAYLLAINGGDFAATYGFAQKTDNGWVSDEGDTVKVTIDMDTSQGYLDEYTIRSVVYTDDRADYPQLTDEEFANFREVTTTGMAAGRFYRGASPLNDERGRAAYAAAAVETSGIRTVLNLADTEEKMRGFKRYPDSYYAGTAVICLAMGMDLNAPDNMTMLAEGLRFAVANDGPIYVHCKEGKDRTGFVCAVLELLAGASREEMIADYMQTYANYYGLTAEDRTYQLICGSFERMLVEGLGESLDARMYLTNCGLSADEIDAVYQRLTR